MPEQMARRAADGHAVLVKEPERPKQSLLAPTLPSEALALSGPRREASNLLLYPVSGMREPPTGVADRKLFTQPRRLGLICWINPLTG